MYHLLPFHGNDNNANAPQDYVYTCVAWILDSSIMVSFAMNLKSSVSIVTRLWIYVRVTLVRLQAAAIHDVQNGSGAHTAYIKGYRQIVPRGINLLGREANGWQLTSFSAEIKH
jgi:hypothetical protein